MTIRAMSYAESRLDYFRRKAAKRRKTAWRWLCQEPGEQYDQQTIHEICSDLAREISYLDDVIAMLEKEEVEL